MRPIPHISLSGINEPTTYIDVYVAFETFLREFL